MIISGLKDVKFYADLFPKCKKGFDFLTTLSDQTPEQKYEIQDGIWASVFTAAAKDIKNCKLEKHNEYIDIQFVIKGIEVIGMKTDGQFGNAIADYDKSKDIIFFDAQPDYSVKLKEGDFAVIFTDEAHAPESSGSPVKKVVVKIRKDLLR
jgi:YhcH/YjgK/YiaL family protein